MNIQFFFCAPNQANSDPIANKVNNNNAHTHKKKSWYEIHVEVDKGVSIRFSSHRVHRIQLGGKSRFE